MIKHALSVGFHSIILWLDAVVYEFVTVMYRIFLLLANANIFTEEFYQNISQRVYVLLGVVMLFVLAYALLKAMVDPEQLTKGDKGIAKIVPTFVTSLILCGILPSIFNFAYELQTFVLSENNTIGILVLGEGQTLQSKELKGTQIAKDTLFTFIDTKNVVHFGKKSLEDIEKEIDDNNFFSIISMADAIADDEVIYRWGFSTAVGLFLIYVLATFCLDLAVRAVRFAFLQLIAPVPILMRVMPMKNDIFKNWLKKTTSCYMEVFVRVLIMYLALLFIDNLQFSFITDEGIVGKIAQLLLWMGVFMFVKEAPKLLSEVTGIDSGNIKLGIKDFMGKLGAGGAFVAGGLLGGGVVSGIRNLSHAGRNIIDAKGFTGKLKAGAGGLFSGAAGAISGAARGGYGAREAKNFKDMRKAVSEGYNAATKARDEREIYRANHGGMLGAMGAHARDFGRSAGELFGIGDDLEALKRRQTALADVNAKRKTAWDNAKAEMLKKVQQRRASKMIYTESGEGYDNLSELDNLIDIAKTQGTDAMGNKLDGMGLARYQNELQAIRSKLEDQLTTDYLNGWYVKTDEATGATYMDQDTNQIDGRVQADMVAFNTAVAQNQALIKSNLSDINRTSLSEQITQMDVAVEKTRDMKREELIASGMVADLMDNTKKVAGAANANVDAKINEHIQKAQADKK